MRPGRVPAGQNGERQFDRALKLRVFVKGQVHEVEIFFELRKLGERLRAVITALGGNGVPFALDLDLDLVEPAVPRLAYGIAEDVVVAGRVLDAGLDRFRFSDILEILTAGKRGEVLKRLVSPVVDSHKMRPRTHGIDRVNGARG